MDEGGFCSKHKHEHKFNAFFVEEGQLEVTTYKNDYDLVDVTVLGPLERTTCKPGEYHEFKALTKVIAYELYWTQLDPLDIVRENHGGSADAGSDGV